MLKHCATLGTLAVLVAGCSGTPAPAQDGPAPIEDPSGARRVARSSPMTYRVPASELPPQGKCRVRALGFANQDCDGVERLAPLQSQLLYRPSYKYLVVCLMSNNEGAVIVGADVYDSHSGQHIAVLLTKDGQKPAADCKGIWDALKDQLGLG